MKRNLKVTLGIVIILAFIATSLGLTAIAVNSIKINANSVNIAVAKTYKLNVTFTPGNATNKKVTFSSANKKIATVSTTGYIKGIIPGKTVITVTSASNKKAVAKCNVTVYKKTVSISIGTNIASNQGIVDNNYIFQQIEKQEGIRFKFVRLPAENTNEKLGLLIASNSFPDLLVGAGNQDDLITQDALGVVSKELLRKAMPKYIKAFEDLSKEVETDGWLVVGRNDKMYSIPQWWYGGMKPGYCRLFRMDLLKSVGINKVPETIEEYTQAGSKLKTKGIYLMGGRGRDLWWQCFTDIYGAYAYVPNQLALDPSTGKLTVSWLLPEMKDALNTLAKWYKAGYIDPEWITDDSTVDNQKFLNGKVASFTWGHVIYSLPNAKKLANYDNTWEQAKRINENAEVVYAPYVKGPAGKSGWTGSLPFNQGFLVSKALAADTYRLERLMMFLEKAIMVDFNLYALCVYGEEGVDWSYDSQGILRVNQDIISNTDYKNKKGIDGPVGYMVAQEIVPKIFKSKFSRRAFDDIWDEFAADPRNKLYFSKSIKPGPVELSKYNQTLNDIFREYIDSVILGNKTTDSFEEYRDKWLKAGGQEQLDWQNANNLKYWKK